MKYRFVIILLMFMFVGSAGNAQTFRDSNNMQLGKVESDGTVRNANNMCIGKIFEDGTIRDSNNMRLGTVQFVIITICVLVLSVQTVRFVITII